MRRLDDGVLRFDVEGSASLHAGEPGRAIASDEAAPTPSWSVLGSRVGLAASPAVGGDGLDRLVHLLDMFPPADPEAGGDATGYTVRPDDRVGVSLWRDGALVGRADDVDALIPLLLADVTGRAVASFGGFAAHAAVVTGPAGSVALLGESGAGKSTLTAACLRQGLGYCSDEALCLSYDTAAVVPFPKPISLLATSPMLPVAPGTRRLGGYFHAAELGGVVDHDPPTVAHVVVLGERVTGAPVLARAGAADGVAALLTMGFNHFRAPAQAVGIATRIVTDAVVWHLRAGDPAPTAALVAELVGTSGTRDDRRPDGS